ncbi:MAG: hypothetical protein AB1469_00590 [Pseudomonadota bacterium]
MNSSVIKEAIIYLIVAVAALVILGYSVHMLVGGLVSPATEYTLIAVACLVGALVIAYMAWDVIRLRKRRGGSTDRP